MNAGEQRSLPSNPFATRFTRPGALPFLFVDDFADGGHGVDRLVARLEQHAWWGQIIGPHGSGKSTLLAAIEPALRSRHRDPVVAALHDGERSLPAEILNRTWTPSTQLIVDGYEQLSRRQRWRLKQRCRQVGCGLLVTAHHNVGMPTLYRTRPSMALLQQIVRRLHSAGDPDDAQAADLKALFDRHEGDVREALFELYDRFEQRHRQ